MEITATYNFTFFNSMGLATFVLLSKFKRYCEVGTVPVWSKSTDMGSNHKAAKGGRIIQAAPSVAEIRPLLRNN